MPLHKIKRILSCAENEMTFFKKINRFHSVYSHEYKMIERAYDGALHAFSEMYRDAGGPYFAHVRSVLLILMEYLHIYERRDLTFAPWEIMCAALLHDNPEDRPDIWPLSRVERDFSRNVAFLLDYVAKRNVAHFNNDQGAQLQFYHTRLSLAPIIEILLLKLSDRLHNQLTLWSCDEIKIRRKMRETEEIYIPLARKWGVLAHELEATVEGFEDRLESHLRYCKI
jgi:GTP diphosphokinase / guanosine-3',5'-bis(diphosphate) 3'-diphosphatase